MSSIVVILNFSVNRGINQKRMIGWIVFYAVLAIFQTYNGGRPKMMEIHNQQKMMENALTLSK